MFIPQKISYNRPKRVICVKKYLSYAADAAFILAGSLLFAASVNLFTAPANIAAGGLTGIATMLNYLFRLPIGTSILVMNIPLFLLAKKHSGTEFLIRTAAATLAVSLMIDLTAGFFPPAEFDMLITTVYGGILSGAGLSLIFIRGATTGGTDLAATLVNRFYPSITIGRIILVIDAVVVAVSAFVYGNAESPLYAVLVIFISTKVLDTVLMGTGRGTGKLLYVITAVPEKVSSLLLNRINRGVTSLRATGEYKKSKRTLLLCALRSYEIPAAYKAVREADPKAFMLTGAATEISGEGFIETQ